MKLEGERLGDQESISKCLQVEMSGQPDKRDVGAFYSPLPLRESTRWGVRDPDMSGSGVRHVRQTSLEPCQGTRQVRLQALTRDKDERANIYGSGARHIRLTSL
jgi:hypothetical protein